jgi:citrate synthase
MLVNAHMTACRVTEDNIGKTTLSVPADMTQVCCSDPDMRQLSCMRLIAKMPTLAAIAYKTAKGMDIISAMLANRSMPAFM